MVTNGRHRRPVDPDDREGTHCGHKKRSATDQRLGLCYACRETRRTSDENWV
ncbi:hypothetical protein ACFO5R_17375 [Halosolutus amylolyticus]|uniref:HNH endonuclease n=1 Tax=Halosolutus amylolyticus TaxID=2932267 RepID=A0ABD5PT65_9EURY|nr:hypothetical protein [Halosolutus amylolyticus]